MKGEWTVTPIEGVSITYEWEGWTVKCTWPIRQRQDVVTIVTVENQGKLLSAAHRLNLFSLSAVTALTRTLKSAALSGEEGRISEFVQHLVTDVDRWYKQGAATVNPEPKQREGGGWLLYPIWPSVGVTGVAAAAGSFKSLIAQAIALELVTGEEVLSGNTRVPNKLEKVLYLDWEADAETFSERLYGLCAGAGLEQKPWVAYKQMRAPLSVMAPQIAEEIGRSGTQAVIVDSMSAGIGGPLVDDESVNAFFDSLRLLGVPALVVAHKSAENVRQRNAAFFGSIMSENRVRLAWNAERDVDTPTVVWQVFKDNTMGKKGARLAWNVLVSSEGTHEHQRLNQIVVTAVDPHDARVGVEGGSSLAGRIEVELIGGPLRVVEITRRIDSTDATVRKVLHRYPDTFVQADHGQWGLSDSPPNPDPY